MADVLERQKRRPAAPPRDPRETLEPLLDELMRTLRFERAVVLLYDDERAALAGSFGTGVSDAIARELLIPLALVDDPIVASLRGGVPQLIRDATLDERISAPVRETLSKAKLGPIVAAPLRSTTERCAGLGASRRVGGRRPPLSRIGCHTERRRRAGPLRSTGRGSHHPAARRRPPSRHERSLRDREGVALVDGERRR